MANSQWDALGFGGKAIADWLGKGNSPWQPTFDANQQPVSQELSQYFQGLNPQSFSYTGQMTAPMTAGQSQVVDQSSRLGALANNTYSQLGSYDPNQVNSDFNNNIENPSWSNFTNNIAPYLRENLNGFSSEQGNVLSRAALTNQNNLDQQRMTYQQNAKDTALSALQGGSQFNTSNMALQSVPQAIQQAGLSNAYTNFTNSNQQYSNALQQMLGYLNVQSQAYVQQPNQMQQLLGAGQSAAQIAAAMGSVGA